MKRLYYACACILTTPFTLTSLHPFTPSPLHPTSLSLSIKLGILISGCVTLSAATSTCQAGKLFGTTEACRCPDNCWECVTEQGEENGVAAADAGSWTCTSCKNEKYLHDGQCHASCAGFKDTHPEGRGKFNLRCENDTPCRAGVEWQTTAASADGVMPRQCKAVSTCNVGYAELVAPAETTDRVCSSQPICHHASCSFDGVESTYSGAVAVTEGGDACQAWSSAEPNSHPFNPAWNPPTPAEMASNHCRLPDTGTPSEPKPRPWCFLAASKGWGFCNVCSQYFDVSANNGKGGCASFEGTECSPPATYESEPRTATSDRACSATTVCDPSLGLEESVAPTATSDRGCGLRNKKCSARSEYQVAPPSRTSGRICLPLTVCDIAGGTEYESAAPTWQSDRVCRSVSTCADGVEYEYQAATSKSDRVCKQLLVASSASSVRNASFRLSCTPNIDVAAQSAAQREALRIKLHTTLARHFRINPDSMMCSGLARDGTVADPQATPGLNRTIHEFCSNSPVLCTNNQICSSCEWV